MVGATGLPSLRYRLGYFGASGTGQRPHLLRSLDSGARTAFSSGHPNKKTTQGRLLLSGRGDRIRTCDLFTPSEARYQAALRPDTLPCSGRVLPEMTELARIFR